MDPRADAMLERGRGGLQEVVEAFCRSFKIPYYHTWSSIHSGAGFPDLVIDSPLADGRKRILFVELKRQKRRPIESQVRWLDRFGELALQLDDGSVEVLLWRPSHWLSGEIERVLRGGAPAEGIWLPKHGVFGDKFSKPK